MKYEDYNSKNKGGRLLDGAEVTIGEAMTELTWVRVAEAIDLALEMKDAEIADLKARLAVYEPTKPKFEIGEIVVDIQTIRKIIARRPGKDSNDNPSWYYSFEGYYPSVWSHENLLKPLPNKGAGYL